MIPDFKTYIGESVWADIHRRSNGTQERKEDDVNLLDIEEFFDYLDEHYDNKVYYLELNQRSNPDICVGITQDILLYFKPDRGHILLSWSRVKIKMPFLDELSNRFDVENPNVMRRIITDKDGNCTNKTFIDVIDFFIEHKDDLLVNESVWADMHKRSNGTSTREEDYLDDIYDYITSKYQVSYVNMDDIEYKDGHIHIPLFKILTLRAYVSVDVDIESMYFSTININKYKSSTLQKLVKPIKDDLNNLYDKIINTYSPEIVEFDGVEHWIDFKIKKPSKEFCEEFIDFIMGTLTSENSSILKILEKK